MSKPDTHSGYSDEWTLDCERVLVTLLRNLGPWRDSVYLIGGLTPRYLVAACPPDVASHAGTQDVDVVIDLQILADTEAYRSLEDNLRGLGFERARNAEARPVSWRWQTRTESGALIYLEFLADDPDRSGGRVMELPTAGNISAMNIPHASIVFDLHQETEVSARLPGEEGIATVIVKHADIVSFTCLKANAYDHRRERKDAHDLVYCIENAGAGLDAVTAAFRAALAGQHGAVVRSSLDHLVRHFCRDARTEGFDKDGPASVALFEIDGDDADARDARMLRRREVSYLIESLIQATA